MVRHYEEYRRCKKQMQRTTASILSPHLALRSTLYRTRCFWFQGIPNDAVETLNPQIQAVYSETLLYPSPDRATMMVLKLVWSWVEATTVVATCSYAVMVVVDTVTVG